MCIRYRYSNKSDNDKEQGWYCRIEFRRINDENLFYNLGTDVFSLSKFNKALECYARAVELNGDLLDAICQLGITYLSLGNKHKTFKTFEGYLKQDSESEIAKQVKEFIEYLKSESKDIGFFTLNVLDKEIRNQL